MRICQCGECWADLTSTHNLYLRSCSAMLGRALRGGNSSLRERMYSWLCRVYDLGTWEVTHTRLSLSATLGSREVWEEESATKVEETWICDLLEESPELPGEFVALSAFFTNAPEINSKPGLKEATYISQNAGSWY